jgi:hypothetical protein
MKCVKQTWKQIFIMLTCVNMNMKRTWLRLWFKIVLETNVEQTKGSESSY